MELGLLSRLKCLIAPNVSRVRRLPFGLFKGLRLEINFHNQTQLYLGLWENETYRFVAREAKRAEWLIDVGAGKGEHCLVFAREPQVGRIVAVEPDPKEWQRLLANLALNGQAPERVELFDSFAGNDDGQLRLDTLGLPASAPGFIKIDVEGAELDVLNGAETLLSGPKVAMLVECHSPQLERDCLEWLTARGYRCEVIAYAAWRAIIPESRPKNSRWIYAAK